MLNFKLLPTVICLFALAAPAFADGRLSVTGQGVVNTAPDMATISLGVMSEAKTAADALAGNNQATASVLDRVAVAGIAPGDVQTTGLSLSPNWVSNNNDGTSTIVGFVANNQVTVRVRDLQALGGILDDVVRNGANTFNGLTFGLQNPEPVLDEARKKAVEDAIHKAKLYAAAAGIVLGPIVELSEAGDMMPRPMSRQVGAMMEAAVPVAEGEVSVAASVSLVFEIAE